MSHCVTPCSTDMLHGMLLYSYICAWNNRALFFTIFPPCYLELMTSITFVIGYFMTQWCSFYFFFYLQPSKPPHSMGVRNMTLNGHVGFDSLPDQLVNKSVAQGFCFNILCLGECCFRFLLNICFISASWFKIWNCYYIF